MNRLICYTLAAIMLTLLSMPTLASAHVEDSYFYTCNSDNQCTCNTQLNGSHFTRVRIPNLYATGSNAVICFYANGNAPNDQGARFAKAAGPWQSYSSAGILGQECLASAQQCVFSITRVF